MDKKEIIALIKKVGQEQSGCINSDGEYVDFCKGDEEYVFDNEDVNELAEKLIKLFSLHLCCTELKDKTGYNNIDDIDHSWIEYINGNKKTL